MARILGLDLGIRSVGWGLIDFDSGKIIDAGVRIFEMGANNNKGIEESKNSDRRKARQIRRQNFRYKLRRKHLTETLTQLGMMPDERLFQLSAYDLYQLRAKAIDTREQAAEKLTLQEIGRIFFHLNQHRGFKSSRKTGSLTKETEGELEGMKGEMQKLREDVVSAGCRTVGEYFFSQIDKETDQPFHRVRGRHVPRDLYESEFNLIWESQKKFYPEILTGGPIDGNKPRKTSYYRIKAFSIFYQRPLKSQKNLVAKCRFEPTKRVTPKANPLFQEFRLYQALDSIRFTGGSLWNEPLNPEQKQLVIDHLGYKGEIKETELRKLLKYPSTARMNDVKLIGMTTLGRLKDSFGELWPTVTEGQRNELWHLLHFFDDDENGEVLANLLKEKYGWEPSVIEKLRRIRLEPDFSNISAKAIKKILPFMKQDMNYADAARSAGYHHSADLLSSPEELSDKIPSLKPNEIRNPVVQRALTECFKVTNAIIKVYGRPDEIRVEFTRELKAPKQKREATRRMNNEKEQFRKNLAEFLTERTGKEIQPGGSEVAKLELWLEMGLEQDDFLKTEKLRLDDLKKELRPELKQKFRLWIEANRISVYTGKVISFSEMLSERIQIEHIIPYSRSLDNSFINKTLCEDFINSEKSNRTAYEYMVSKGPDTLKEYLKRVMRYQPAKQERLKAQDVPESFQPGSIEMTGYISKEAVKRLKTVCRSVKPTNGQTTGILRRVWDLNRILRTDDINLKNRGDHRHHAIDALVIAATTTSTLQKLAVGSSLNLLGQLRAENIPTPWQGFSNDVRNRIETMLVSYRSESKLVEQRPYKIKTKKGSLIQSGITLRGALHEESVYGKIRVNGSNEAVFVKRRMLSEIDSEKKLEEVVDQAVKQKLKAHLSLFNNDYKLAFSGEHKVFMNKEKGIEIRKVRCQITSSTMKDRFEFSSNPEVKNQQYIKPGNNYLYVLYGTWNSEEGRDFETVSFMDACNRKLKNLPLYSSEKNEKQFLFSLKSGDLVLSYENHPEEIQLNDQDLKDKIYRVIKFSQNGVIVFGKFHVSDILPDKDPQPIVLRKTYTTMRVLPVKINILGRISYA